jgi:hypothetical protein
MLVKRKGIYHIVLFVELLTRRQCVSGRSCDRPSRHKVFLVFLSIQANTEMVPKIQVVNCVLLMQASRLKFIKATK